MNSCSTVHSNIVLHGILSVIVVQYLVSLYQLLVYCITCQSEKDKHACSIRNLVRDSSVVTIETLSRSGR